jgi:hypothetical protein
MRAKNFSPLREMPDDHQHSPFFQAVRSESIGRKRIAPKNINLGEVAYLPPTQWSRQGGKAAPCRIFGVRERLSTDSRKAAPCGDLPRPTIVSFSRLD